MAIVYRGKALCRNGFSALQALGCASHRERKGEPLVAEGVKREPDGTHIAKPTRRSKALDAINADSSRRRDSLLRISGQALTWTEAVKMQGERVSAASFEQSQREMVLFVLALRGLLGSAETARDLGVSVDQALAAFDDVASSAKDVRDILSHLPDYALGVGRLQADGSPPVEISYARGAAAGTAIIISNPSMTLNVGAAITGVDAFAAALQEAIRLDVDSEA
mgnify:CR=1 FL=1